MLRILVSSLVCLSLFTGCASFAASPSPSPFASTSPSAGPSPAPGPTGASTAPSSSQTPTVSPAASPTSSPDTSSSDSFKVLPGRPPADFVSQITCSGSIGASDPVAIVQLHAAVEGTGNVVLRDYANPASPRTACTFPGGQFRVVQLIDARHVVIATSSTYAVVDLPEVQFHWFQLPSYSAFLAVSPGLDQVLWSKAIVAASTVEVTVEVHITTSAGDRVVASLPQPLGDRCGSTEDSRRGAFTHSGAHAFVLDQPFPGKNSLLVIEDEEVVLSLLPPSAGWPEGTHPRMAVWSPTAETLFYSQGGDVWQWTPAGGTQRYLSGVNWYFPTITPDGGHLAYSVVRPDGLHNVYLVDLAHGGSAQLIGEARNLPVFVNNEQLWYKSEGQGVCGPGSDKPLIYNLADGSESPSIIDQVFQVWPATSPNY